MKKALTALALASSLLLPASYGIPTLQLDASNASWVGGSEETTIANSPDFTLYALFNGLNPSGTFYISAALTPASQSGNYGSFVFNGTTVDVTSDMSWGTPNSLPDHDIFPTFYKEFAFTFNVSDSSNQFTNYDVEELTGTHNGPTQSSTGNARFAAFSVDLSDLSPDVAIHFDLYNYSLTNKGELKIKFAPFSHDAEGGGGHEIPDSGTTAILLGAGLVLLSLFRRKAV